MVMVPSSGSTSGVTAMSPTVTDTVAGSMAAPSAALATWMTASRVPPAVASADVACSKGLWQSPTRRARFSEPPTHLV